MEICKGDEKMSAKWIKLSTHMFDDEKIKLIEKMPEADTILIIWIKLLSQAGKTNASGYIYLSETIPYTDEMLSAIFDRPLNTVRMALQTFQKFGMVELQENDLIYIENWDKYQNTEGLEKIREQNRLRKQKERERKRIMLPDHENVTGQSRDMSQTIDIDIDIDKEKDIKDNVFFSEIVNYLNDAAGKQYKSSSKKTRDLIKARINEGFTVDDFKKVIEIKVSQWLNDPKMEIYLRPETLFSNKFEGYLNQKGGSVNERAPITKRMGEEYDLGF